jgi:hypothetical protein
MQRVRKLAENPGGREDSAAPVFQATHQYFELLGKELAENAWISPTADHPLKGSRLDPKLPLNRSRKQGDWSTR